MNKIDRPRAGRSERCLGYRQFQVKQYIDMVVARDGIAPSYDMIAYDLGISGRGNVSHIVAGLEKRGLLRRVGKWRCPRNQVSRNVRRIVFTS